MQQTLNIIGYLIIIALLIRLILGPKKSRRRQSKNIKVIEMQVDPYDKDFVELASEMSRVRSATNSTAAMRKILEFERRYKGQGKHSEFEIRCDVSRLVDLLEKQMLKEAI